MEQPIIGKKYKYVGEEALPLFDEAMIKSTATLRKGHIVLCILDNIYRTHNDSTSFQLDFTNLTTDFSDELYLPWNELFIPFEIEDDLSEELSLYHVADLLEDTLYSTDVETLVDNLKLCIKTLRREGY